MKTSAVKTPRPKSMAITPDLNRPTVSQHLISIPRIESASDAKVRRHNVNYAYAAGISRLSDIQLSAESRSSQSMICADAMVRFGISGLSVPAATFELSISRTLANSLASCSFRNVSVNRHLPGALSAGSNDTYHVSLDLSERGRRFIYPWPSAIFRPNRPKRSLPYFPWMIAPSAWPTSPQIMFCDHAQSQQFLAFWSPAISEATR
jgi:hypothetical protein